MPKPQKPRQKRTGQIPSSLVVAVVVGCVAVAGLVLLLFSGTDMPGSDKANIGKLGSQSSEVTLLAEPARKNARSRQSGIYELTQARGTTPQSLRYQFSQSRPTPAALEVKTSEGNTERLPGTTEPLDADLQLTGSTSQPTLQEALRYLLDDKDLILGESNIRSARVVAIGAKRTKDGLKVRGLLLRKACSLPVRNLTPAQQEACIAGGVNLDD